jgi:hypothetical protein
MRVCGMRLLEEARAGRKDGIAGTRAGETTLQRMRDGIAGSSTMAMAERRGFDDNDISKCARNAKKERGW